MQPLERGAGMPLLELFGVTKRFASTPDLAARLGRFLGAQTAPDSVLAVNDVTLTIAAGEVVGLVGESGCGKSTLGRIAAGLIAPTSGIRKWKGEEPGRLSKAKQRQRQLGIQMVFQDPTASLNPRMRASALIGEAPVAHGLIRWSEQEALVADLMQRVGLDPGGRQRYAHQFSGGQRARIGIARALAVQPELLVCDEAVAALDVSIQAQVLNLFIRLREELNLAYLFISHDLGVVRHIADRVMVMYLGRIIESGPAEEVLSRPNHPYTISLLACAPTLDAKPVQFLPVRGELPSPLAPPSGCHFHPRCPHAMERCRQDIPALKEVAPGHVSACHLNDRD